VPAYSATIALYDLATNTVRAGPSVGAGNFVKYDGGVVLPDGRVVLVPLHSPTIGLYDPGQSDGRSELPPAYTCTLSRPLLP
jgi:hypothetical protein